MEDLEDKAAEYLEETGISGDTMVQCDMTDHKGWMNLHDIMAGFVRDMQPHNRSLKADKLPVCQCGNESFIERYGIMQCDECGKPLAP